MAHTADPTKASRRTGDRAPERLRDVHDVLLAAGLRPIVDGLRSAVLSDCPVCDDGGEDPDGIHRPLTIGCSTARPSDPVRVCCHSGCSPQAIGAALKAPAIDWQAVAAQYAVIADDAIAQLEASVTPFRTTLKAVA